MESSQITKTIALAIMDQFWGVLPSSYNWEDEAKSLKVTVSDDGKGCESVMEMAIKISEAIGFPPMTPKAQFFAAVRAADITNEDWIEACLPIIIGLPFASGYLARLQKELGSQLDTRTEDYREAILETEEADIWK